MGLGARASAQWTTTAPLPDGYNGHALIASGAYLYNTGGSSNSNGILDSRNVFYAPVTGGTIGAWKPTTPLPEGVYYHAGVAANGFVYVLGGQHFDAAGNVNTSNVVYYAKTNADGTLGAWTAANALPEPVFFLAAAVWNGRIYVTGGWNGTNLTAGVYSAALNADGSLGAWVSQRPLPEPLYTHATVSNGTLYVLGGAVNGGTQIANTVYFSTIAADGTLSAWAQTTPLPTPLSNHAGIYGNGTVFVMGGWTGSQMTSAVVKATAQTGGALSAWASAPAMPDALYLHSAAVSGQYIFVSGGADAGQTVPTVFSLPLPPPPVPPDTTAPTTTLSFGAPKYASAPPFISPATPITLSAVDQGGGTVASTKWALDAGAFAPYSSPFTIGPDGAHGVRYFSTDSNGNVEAVKLTTAAVDGTAPVSSLSIGSPKAILSTGAVVVGPATQLAAAAVDPVVGGVASGVAQLLVGVDGGALAAYAGPFALPAQDGAHQIALQATDNLGNAEAAHAQTVYRDGTAPATTVSPDGSQILGANAALSFSAQDPVVNGIAAGVNHTEYQLDGGAWTTATATQPLPEGAHSVAYRSVDNVGNVEAAKTSAYKVDLTAPQTTLTAGAPSQTALGITFMTASATLTLSAQDPLSNGVASGVARTLYSIDGGADQVYAAPFTLPAGRHTLSFGSVDNAGNAEPRQSATFFVSPFLADLFEGQSAVSLSGMASVTGTARSDGTIALSQSSTINGSAMAMLVTLSGGSTVSGTVVQGQSTLPAPPDLAATKAWADANDPNPYEGTLLSVAAGQSLSVSSGVYSLTGLSLGAGAALTFAAPAQVFVHGPISLGAGASLNAGGDPAQLFVVSDGSSVTFGAGARASAELFAPSAAVSLVGNGDFSGRLLGASVSIVGSTDVLPPRTTASVGQPQYGSNPIFVTPATPVSLSAVDDATTVGDAAGSGVQATNVAIDAGAFSVYTGPVTLSGDGSHWVTYYSVDKLGNAEAGHQLSLAVDATPPASSLSIGSPQAVLGSGAVVVGPATQLAASASDPAAGGVASGVSRLLAGVDGAALSAYAGAFALPAQDGAHTISLQAFDNVGNAETAHSQTVYRDGTAPVTTVSPDASRILGAAGGLSFSAQDPVVGGIASGVARTEAQVDGGAWAAVSGLALTEGVHAVSYRSVDNVGNVETAKSATYKVDLTAPQTTLSESGGLTLFGVDAVTPDTSFSLSAQDPVSNGVASGVASTVYSIDGGADQAYAAPFKLSAGAHTISYGSVDNAGNVEARRTVSVSVSQFLTDALAGLDSVSLSGGARVTGAVRSNGSVTLAGESTVTGDVTAMTVTKDGRSAISGVVTQGQATLPASSYDLAAARAWAQANNQNASLPLSNGALTLSGGSLNIAAGSYYLTGLSLSGHASVAVSGTVYLFVDGPISIAGQAALNAAGDANNLWIVQGSGDDSLAGGDRAAFNLYAPNSNVAHSGEGAYAGRQLGKTVSLSGKAQQPSTTSLPAPTHVPGGKKSADSGAPGVASAGGAERDGKGDSVAFDDLSTKTPSSSVGKDSQASMPAPAPQAPAEKKAENGSGSWHASAAAVASSAVVTAPARHLSQNQGSGDTKSKSSLGDVASSDLSSAPPSAGGFSSAGVAPFPISRDDGPALPAASGRVTVKNAMPPLALSKHHALAVVDDSGSAVHATDGSGVVLPPGAIASGLAVSVAQAAAAAPAEKRRQDDASAKRGLTPAAAAVQYGPEGTHFAKPVTLEIPYDPAKLPGGAVESALAIHYWNPGTGDWEYLASSVDTQNHVVRAQTSHFSLYQIFAGAAAAAAPAPGATLAFGQVYAYPNPARGGQSPVIHVEAGSADHIEIHIYDLSGQLKDSTTSDGAQTAFEYRWDTSGVGSGVYIYVVTASQSGGGKIRRTGRVAVIK